MAVTKAFSIEDGNLASTQLVSAREQQYKDIDLTFTAKPSGDIFKKLDAADVKQSVKNLLMTNYTEKPFMQRFGGNLSALLFRLSTEVDDMNLESEIINAIETYEPRAKVLNINSVISPDNNDVRVTVTFQVLSTLQQDVVEINLTRLR